MNNKIKLKHIIKIQNASMRLFEAEDEDYPDYIIVKANEKAIDYWLNKITSDKNEQIEICRIIKRHNFNSDDMTFTPICDDLRKLGYEIEVE